MRLDEASRSGQRAGGQSALATGAVWRSRRAGFFSAARLAMLRAAHSRWLLLVVALGILVADVLICTVPLYSRLVSDVQLQNTVANSDSLARNMQIAVRTQNVSRSLQQQVTGEIQQQANKYLASFSTPHPTSYITSGGLSLDQAGTHIFGSVGNSAQARMEAFDFAALKPYLHFDQGTFPQTAAPGAPVQVIVTHEMAKDWNLKVGQTIVFGGLVDVNRSVTATITGIFAPINPNDPFWNGLTFNVTRSDNLPPIYPLLTTTDSFFSTLSPFESLGMTQTLVYYADLNRIDSGNMGAIADDILLFHTHATVLLQDTPGVANVLTQGGLDQIIKSVQTQLSLIAMPLYVIAAQIVGLALLFVAAMASLLIEQQSQGIATLKSRGTSSSQLLGIFTTQSALLGLLAAIAGPFLAAGLALVLVRRFVLAGALPAQRTSIGEAYVASVASPSQVILPAIIGAVLGIAAVTFAALQAARLDVLAFRREMARPSRQPFWRRTYLDIGLALLCLVGYLELGQFGGTQTRLQLGGQGNSPLLLVTPALLLLAGGLLLLRFVPVFARLGARVASRGRGLTVLLAFSQIERTPSRYARMTLLLVLAVGLGVFALTFDASLARNVHDRTAYAAGADVRMTVNPQISVKSVNKYIGHLYQLPDVQGATALYRTYGSTSADQGNLAVDMLGVDSTTFAGVANPLSWRSDYASQSLPALMTQMNSHRATSQSEIVSHPIWCMVSDTFAAQLLLKTGDRFQLDLSDIPFATPTFVVGAIVHDFPTLYPQRAPGGFIVVDLRDLEYTIAANSDTGAGALIGPNEFWLRTTSATRPPHALLQALDREQYDLSLNSVNSYAEELRQAEANPVNGGMRGLLLIGALTAALLAVLGLLAQAVLAARQRAIQFAIFRTLGMAGRQLTGLLLGEQVVVYLIGLLGGTLLGLLLTTATWPYLTFSDTAVDPTTVGVPGYQVVTNWEQVGLFYGVLLLAFGLALLIAARYAATIGLGKTLRLGED
ncbi:MAG: ABC transporter permease [Nitrososphaerota archaeon]